eukprot:COSAG04_NODE_3868_length_2461_cov_5.849704_1_plen_62_part_10
MLDWSVHCDRAGCRHCKNRMSPQILGFSISGARNGGVASTVRGPGAGAAAASSRNRLRAAAP